MVERGISTQIKFAIMLACFTPTKKMENDAQMTVIFQQQISKMANDSSPHRRNVGVFGSRLYQVDVAINTSLVLRNGSTETPVRLTV